MNNSQIERRITNPTEREIKDIEAQSGLHIDDIWIVLGMTIPSSYYGNNPTYRVILFSTGRAYHGSKYGHIEVQYILYSNEDIIFRDILGYPNVANYSKAEHIFRSIESVLGFVTLGVNDVGEYFFKDYSKDQLEWRDKHAEDLSLFNYSLDEFIGGNRTELEMPTVDSFFVVKYGHLICLIEGLNIEETYEEAKELLTSEGH